ncbi:hypothetical protein [Oleiharenicola lentus]|uniref:hypothetical protein n=1 Tax=Oleiharenicola lentus TaxID=2508720 RepID=UPI003F67CA87
MNGKSTRWISAGVLALVCCLGSSLPAATYYINNLTGSNSNAGTSTGAPWADFTHVNTRTFVAGDQILLARGGTWNQELVLRGSGATGNFIVVDAYGSGNKPKIQRNNVANDRTVKMFDTSFWKVRNLEICNAGDGIRLNYTAKGNQSVHFENLYIHDINLIVNGSPSSTDSVYYSTGIVIFSDGQAILPTTTTDYLAKDIIIDNCEIAGTTAPFTFLHRWADVESPWSFANCKVINSYIHDFKACCSVRGLNNSYIEGNVFANGANIPLPQGTCGLFVFRVDTVYIQNNVMDTIPNTGSGDMTWIDNEAYCNNVRVIGNTIKNTAGSGLQFLAIGGGTQPPRGNDDHNTLNFVDGNTFSNNAGGAMRVVGSTPALPSGTASNNTYTGAFFIGNSSGFTLTNNTLGETTVNAVVGQSLGATRNDFTGSVGFKFTTGAAPVKILSLGRFVVSGNTGSHTVKLVDASTNAEVASATVNTSGKTAGEFAYATLTSPVTLSASHSYYLLSAEGIGGDTWHEYTTTLTTTSALTITSAAYQYGGAYSTYSTAGHAYGPVSFQYAVTGGTNAVTGQSLGTARNDYTGFVGCKFTTGAAPLSVVSLGRFVRSGNTGVHTVKIVDAATGAEVASTAVDTAGKTAGQFSYAPLSNAVVLSPSRTYYLLTHETNGGDSWYDHQTTVTTTGALTVNCAEYYYGIYYYDYSTAGHTYGPVSFQYQ